METVISLWPLWLIGALAFASYTAINHMARIAAVLGKIDMKLKDIAPLFFNGRKFIWFVISAFITFGFFMLFSVSLFINIIRAIRLTVKLF